MSGLESKLFLRRANRDSVILPMSAELRLFATNFPDEGVLAPVPFRHRLDKLIGLPRLSLPAQDFGGSQSKKRGTRIGASVFGFDDCIHPAYGQIKTS